MNNRINIRKAKKHDIEILLELSTRVSNSNNRQFLSKEMVDNFMKSEFFIKEITDNIDMMKLIEFDHKIIGLCVWEKDKLNSLMIDPSFQGKGYGKTLLLETTKERLNIYDTLYLECFKPNKTANAFYKSLGWILYDTVYDEDLNIFSNLYKLSK